MSEVHSSQPEAQINPPEVNVATKGLMKAVNKFREVRIGQLESGIKELETEITATERGTTGESSITVNQNTAKYARIRLGTSTLKDKPPDRDQDKEEWRENWKTMTRHLSPTPAKAKDGTDSGDSLRPTTKKQLRFKKKIEKTESKVTRHAGVRGDMHKIYDLPGERTSQDTPEPPDRSPRRGNARARLAVDESLRRADLLKDQPPQEIAPKIRVGTIEHSEKADSLSTSGVIDKSELRGFKRAAKIHTKHDNAATKLTDQIINAAEGRDGSADQSEDVEKLTKKVDKKRAKLEKHRSALNGVDTSSHNLENPDTPEEQDRSGKAHGIGKKLVATARSGGRYWITGLQKIGEAQSGGYTNSMGSTSAESTGTPTEIDGQFAFDFDALEREHQAKLQAEEAARLAELEQASNPEHQEPVPTPTVEEYDAAEFLTGMNHASEAALRRKFGWDSQKSQQILSKLEQFNIVAKDPASERYSVNMTTQQLDEMMQALLDKQQ